MPASFNHQQLYQLSQSAMEQAAHRQKIAAEAARHEDDEEEKDKKKALMTKEECGPDGKTASVQTKLAMALADALDYASIQVKHANNASPVVSEATSSGKMPEAGHQGTAHNKVPPTRTTHLGAIETSLEQPPGGGGTQHHAISGGGGHKVAKLVLPPFRKAANATGPGETPAVQTSGEAPAVSVGLKPKDDAALNSNEAATNATKRDVAAPRKADLKQYLSEPAQTSATDSTLQQVFSHNQEAGSKISSIAQETLKLAASRALVAKLAAEDDKRKKEEERKARAAGDE